VMGHVGLAERIRELGWERYKDMPAFSAYTAPPPNENADDGRSAPRQCRDAHLAAAESSAASSNKQAPTHAPAPPPAPHAPARAPAAVKAEIINKTPPRSHVRSPRSLLYRGTSWLRHGLPSSGGHGRH
jgi:hypothetical protein